MKRVLLILCLIQGSLLVAQTSERYNSKYAGFYAAEDLFRKEQYASARVAFHEFQAKISDPNDPFYIQARYYEGISALELFNNDAIQMLEDFNRHYPESVYKYDIYFRIGRYYYQKKDYKTTLHWFQQLTRFQLKPEQVDEYYFKLGYSLFELDRFSEARNAFYEIKDGSSTYAPSALYYYSHIAYQEQAYQSALEGFEKLVTNPQFRQIAHHYVVQIYYRMKRFEDVVRLGPTYLDSLSGSAQLEMNHLIGDAYFELGKYDEAVLFLKKYNQAVKTKRPDDYQLAYALYRSSAYDEAIELFDQIARIKDTLGQISLYHIGECYLKLGNNAYARTAFEAASFIAINEKIREDALYNYAILSYKLDVNPYDEAIEALELYLEKYPNSDRKKEVYEYLLNVYTSTNNYALALRSLDKIKDKDSRLRSAYQLIAYNQGVDFNRKSAWEESIKAFSKVATYDENIELTALANYWTGDAQYHLKRFDASIKSWRDFLNHAGAASSNWRKDAIYNIAYAYYSRQKYADAIEQFKLYLLEPRLNDPAQKSDVLLRMADACYTTRQNDQAIKYYQEHLALNVSAQDHALYYLAKTYGWKNDSPNKIKMLLDLINNHSKSRYLSQAIYDLALTYRYINEDDQAERYFTQLCRDYPNSSLVREARIELADIAFTLKDYQKAESLYRELLSENEGSRQACVRIGKSIIEIYRAQRQLDKIDKLFKDYPCTDSLISDQEEIYYNTALEPYLDSSFAEAIPELEKYLTKYAKGKYELEIRYYLGHCYEKEKQELKAIELYKQVLQFPNSDFTEPAALYVSRYLYNSGDYIGALPHYIRLEKGTASAEVAYNSQIGVLRCQYLLENWNDAYLYAQKVLSNTKLTPVIRTEAKFVEGMAAFRLKEYGNAREPLQWVVDHAGNIFAAEAKYTQAELEYSESKLDKAEAIIKELLKMKPGYDFWIAKGLILQTRILMAKNDLFQAEYTLKSVLDHYPNKEDGIITAANQLWDELMQVKNKPKNVQDPGTTVIEIKENGK